MVTPTPVDRYNLIYTAAKKEIDRLAIPHHFDLSDQELMSRNKSVNIRKALERLFQAVLVTNPEIENQHKTSSFFMNKIDKKRVSILNLSTIDEMLDSEFSIWMSEIEPWSIRDEDFNGRREGYYGQISLRTALNISRNNILNHLGGSTWGPLWGKTKALELVEIELGI